MRDQQSPVEMKEISDVVDYVLGMIIMTRKDVARPSIITTPQEGVANISTHFATYEDFHILAQSSDV